MTKVKLPEVYASVDCIYPGPHVSEDGRIDNRIWFHIPVDVDVENDYVTYIVFPFGAKTEDIKELTVSASGSWVE